MKKAFTTFLLVIVLCIVLVSCNVTSDNDTDIDTESKVTTDDTNKSTNVSENLDSDNTDNDSNTNESDTNTEKPSNTLVPNDEEFPFDNIIVERNGYDIVAAGKYYGNDFDNVKDYGSYYRIIDNYEDFSDLTQWGNQIDEAIFDENFILVLYSYSKSSVYYSHPNFNELNGLGQFKYLEMGTSTDKLSIFEIWVLDTLTPDTDDYTPLDYNDYKVVFPKEMHEIIYLIIPKKELPISMHINGEIKLRKGISKAE